MPDPSYAKALVILLQLGRRSSRRIARNLRVREGATFGGFNGAAVHHGGSPHEDALRARDELLASTGPPFITADRRRGL